MIHDLILLSTNSIGPFLSPKFRRRNFPDLKVFKDIPGFEPDKLMAAKTLRDWEQGLTV